MRSRLHGWKDLLTAILPLLPARVISSYRFGVALAAAAAANAVVLFAEGKL